MEGKRKRSPSMLIVVSAPSGCGKTTILKKVMARIPGLVFSVSHTTRKPRPGEKEGEDYFFVSREEFVFLRDREPSEFLEWAEVHGNLYGTGQSAIAGQQRRGLDVVLDIDVQGARQVFSRMDAIGIFIAPPSMEELARRLRGRGTEDEQSLARRLANAETELEAADEYEYLIVNDILDEAVDSFCAVVVAERLRRRRAPDGRVLVI